MKSLKDIALQITEEEYFNDGCIHHSSISNYDKGGFAIIPILFERKESPYLLLGSCVDTLITGTPEEFENKYFVADLPDCPDTIINIVKGLFNVYKDTYDSLEIIPNNIIINITDQLKYQLNWKPDTRAKVIKEKGAEYYRLMFLAQDKTIVSSNMYNTALDCVRALHEAPATKFLFAPNNPFEPNIERLYQLKFRAEYKEVQFSIMIDEVIVFHDKKLILPIDLKTSSHNEWEFFKSFLEWGYAHQSRLYYYVLKENLKNDEYYKDFNIFNWHFVVVNKKTLNPLVWEHQETKERGTLYYGKNKQIEIKDTLELGVELNNYLTCKPSVPNGIKIDKPNNLKDWLNTI